MEEDASFPSITAWAGSPVVVEAAVPPSRIDELVGAAGDAWGALLGVGVVWVGLPDADRALDTLRRKANELGGIAPVIRGVGGLGYELPAPEVHARLKQAFDPAGILAPGRLRH
jgi:FAD/FMN-containing dehydrogenase